MGFNNFKLVSKKNLTIDVFELVFYVENKLDILPGQFITFMLPNTKFARAYSVLSSDGNNFYFIIKRLENGRGGSREICDIDVGTVLKGVGPTGHFLLSKNQNNKLFICTGTGIVPLYFQINYLLENNFSKNIKLILGNRSFLDLYYLEKLDNFKNKYTNFSYEVFLSKEKVENFRFGYVGDYLYSKNISNFDEFYICGNPNMIDEVVLKLKDNSILEENIFFEKF